MDTELTEHEQQVLEANLKNPEALRIWGISSAKTGETVSFVLLVISIAATFVGTCCYFAFGNPAAIYLGTSGFCIVLALAIATVILRAFQRRLQHQDAARIGHELSGRLTGITQHDLAIQADVEEKMEWSARKLNIAGFMILLALGVIAYLNIMQGGGTDMERNMIYSGCIAAEPLVTGRSPCRWCDYGFICCHEEGIGERALDAPAKPFEPEEKKEEDQ